MLSRRRALMALSQEGEEEMKEWKIIGACETASSGELPSITVSEDFQELFIKARLSTADGTNSEVVRFNGVNTFAKASYSPKEPREERILCEKIGDDIVAIWFEGEAGMWGNKASNFVTICTNKIEKIDIFSNGAINAGSKLEVWAR